MTAVWLIYCLNSYQFSWPNCYFCHNVFTCFQSLILQPGFCDSGEAWETKLFYRQEAGRGYGGRGLSQAGPRCPARLHFLAQRAAGTVLAPVGAQSWLLFQVLVQPPPRRPGPAESLLQAQLNSPRTRGHEGHAGPWPRARGTLGARVCARAW